MNYMERTEAMRNHPTIHYNCAQSVLVAFREELGMSEEELMKLGNFLNAGVRHGSICGAVNGMMMVLGAMEVDDQTAQGLLNKFRQSHGSTSCAELLASSATRGEGKKPHCDGLIYEVVADIAALLEEKVEK